MSKDNGLVYDFLNNEYVPRVKFNKFEGAYSRNTIETLLGDTIQLPKDWIVDENNIPITRGALYENQDDEQNNEELMINTNNPETILINNPVEIVEYEPKENKSGNTKYAMKFFMSKGLKEHQAAGLVGNLLRESGLNPKALNRASGAIGIAQWLGDRKKRLVSRYGNNPTFNQQLEFVWDELNSTHRRGLEELLKSSTREQAAANAFGWFEFSVGPQGAIQDMINHKQDGQRAYEDGIRFAKGIKI